MKKIIFTLWLFVIAINVSFSQNNNISGAWQGIVRGDVSITLNLQQNGNQITGQLDGVQGRHRFSITLSGTYTGGKLYYTYNRVIRNTSGIKMCLGNVDANYSTGGVYEYFQGMFLNTSRHNRDCGNQSIQFRRVKPKTYTPRPSIAQKTPLRQAPKSTRTPYRYAPKTPVVKTPTVAELRSAMEASPPSKSYECSNIKSIVTEAETNALLIKWDEISHVRSYSVWYKRHDQKEYKGAAIEGNQIRLEGLQSDFYYHVYVSAECENGTWGTSVPLSVKTKEVALIQRPPIAPARLVTIQKPEPITDQTSQIEPDREIVVSKTYKVTSSKVKIRLWDGVKEDGDIVSILLNGEPVLKEYLLTNSIKMIELNLKKGSNIITLYAHNLGKEPPNTARMRIAVGGRDYELNLSSDLIKSESIELIW